MKHTRVEIGQTTARPKFHKRPTGFWGGPGAWRRQGRKRKLGQGSKVIGRAIYRANSKPFQGDFSLFHGPAGDSFHGRAAWQQEKRGRDHTRRRCRWISATRQPRRRAELVVEIETDVERKENKRRLVVT